MSSCWIMDIDGTVADCRHRRHFVEKLPKDWPAFYEACVDDPPFPHMRRLCHALIWQAPILWVSGRPEKYRDHTADWLYRNRFIHLPNMATFYMRPDEDYRADDVLKLELLGKIRADGYWPIMAFDDRDLVVKMWRANGVPCAQVAEGNF